MTHKGGENTQKHRDNSLYVRSSLSYCIYVDVLFLLRMRKRSYDNFIYICMCVF